MGKSETLTKLTYSMQHTPSWEANQFSASQKIPHILWNPKVHYRIHQCPPPVLITPAEHSENYIFIIPKPYVTFWKIICDTSRQYKLDPSVSAVLSRYRHNWQLLERFFTRDTPLWYIHNNGEIRTVNHNYICNNLLSNIIYRTYYVAVTALIYPQSLVISKCNIVVYVVWLQETKSNMLPLLCTIHWALRCEHQNVFVYQQKH